MYVRSRSMSTIYFQETSALISKKFLPSALLIIQTLITQECWYSFSFQIHVYIMTVPQLPLNILSVVNLQLVLLYYQAMVHVYGYHCIQSCEGKNPLCFVILIAEVYALVGKLANISKIRKVQDSIQITFIQASIAGKWVADSKPIQLVQEC